MNDRDVDKLIFGMAHQIRNPMAIIKANAGIILEKEPLSPEAQRSMESILNGVKYLEDRLDAFVEFSKPLALQLWQVDLGRLLTETITMLEDRCRLKYIRISSNLESIMLKQADRNQLFLAFMNLLLNAVEAVSENGIVSVESRIQGGMALVAITDNGAGIHPRDLPEVFSPFYSTKPNSIGLGLPVAKRAVEAHGGKIEISSVMGQGTQVTVSLPNG